MHTKEGGRPARTLVAAAVVLTASIGIAGCAAVPDSNNPAGSTSRATTTQIKAALADSTSPSRIATWYRHVGPRISSVERAVAEAQHAVRRPGHHGLHAACRVLQSRVEQAEAAQPAPDRVIRHAVERELADLTVGTEHCIDDELLAAGRATNLAHHWSRIADARILHDLRQSS